MSASHRLLSRFARTALHSLPTILGVILLNFALLQLAPGDAADILAGESGSATSETMALMRHHMGLDIPTGQQLIRYLSHLAHFDLGYSARFDTQVTSLIFARLPNTLLLMAAALVVALVLGMTLGVAMYVWRGRWIDRVISVFALLLYSTPGFWFALMLVILFSVELGWLPSGGTADLDASLHGWAWIGDRIAHGILPTLTLASFFVAIYARLTRAAMLESGRQDYTRTAQAKGLHPVVVTLRHVLRNALLPVTTVAGMHFGNLLGGAAVVETVFSWPGLGRLALEAVQSRDYNVLLGVLLISSCLVIVANLLVDVLHTWLDPRIAPH